MMATFTDMGLILRRSTSLDDDVKVTVLLKTHGKITAIMKGARRSKMKLKTLLEPFTEADYQVFAPGHATQGRLINGSLKNSHSRIRTSVPAFSTACRMCEVIDLLIPQRMPSPEVFDILRLSFRWLDQMCPVQSVWIFFAGRLLKNLGYGDMVDGLMPSVPESEREHLRSILCAPVDQANAGPIELPDGVMDPWTVLIDSRLDELLPRGLKSSVLV